MKQIVITLDTPVINALEKQGDKEAIAKVSRILVCYRRILVIQMTFMNLGS